MGLTIAGLTAASCLHIVLYQRDPQRRSARRNLVVAVTCVLGAIVLLFMWTAITEQSSPPARTTDPANVEGQ
ncbi:hypothetical protein [Nocardia ignorata]|uniref:Uncharacterized protein n=1 Tax=Nocardia ignorata TaxID=145285 RepID=A0A4R6P6F4_NOCIG|nr:hypothetical protein [Nocardia ignorata]TDP31569.1 hypothetical protein DFR75_108174 [Nocardia ignorata]